MNIRYFPLFIATIFLLVISPSTPLADTGVFYGSGNQVIPIKNNDIQMVKENVTIKMTIEKNADLGVPFIPLANVSAIFYLKNNANKKVSLQVGFPFLDLQGFGDEKSVLNRLDFKVLSNSTIVKTQLKEGLIEKKLDPDGLFKKVFAWKETFKPLEMKTVVVSYKMLMTVASANSIMRGFDKTGRKYNEIDTMFPALFYGFNYITKSAYTWKGPIEEALFEIDCSDCFQQFERPDFVRSYGISKAEADFSRPVFLELFYPQNFEKQQQKYSWKFVDKVPEDGLSINFLIIFIPSLDSELRSFYKTKLSLLKLSSGDEYTAILKQYYKLLSHNKLAEDSFALGYFKQEWLTEGGFSYVFEKDKDNVFSIASNFDKIITKQQNDLLPPSR